MKLFKVLRMGLLSFVLGCFSSSGPYHKKDGSWFWKNDRMSVNASESLTFLSEDFATADGNAYYRGDRIANSDAATFQVLNEWLTKDKAHVFYSDTYRKDTESWLIKRGRSVVIDGKCADNDDGQKYVRDNSIPPVLGGDFVSPCRQLPWSDGDGVPEFLSRRQWFRRPDRRRHDKSLLGKNSSACKALALRTGDTAVTSATLLRGLRVHEPLVQHAIEHERGLENEQRSRKPLVLPGNVLEP